MLLHVRVRVRVRGREGVVCVWGGGDGGGYATRSAYCAVRFLCLSSGQDS